jgi:hypothetical protein
VNNGAMPDERGMVLKLGTDVGDVESAINLQDDVSAV